MGVGEVGEEEVQGWDGEMTPVCLEVCEGVEREQGEEGDELL